MTESVRLFIAINLDDGLRNEIAAAFLPRIPADGFSKTAPQNLHLTMQFLGEKDPRAVAVLYERLRGLEELEPFDAELGGIGHFDNRVLWLGTKKGTEELRFLAKRIGERIRVPNLDFHAHVTLARNKGCAPDAFSAVVEKLRQADFARRIRVRGFDCMQSTLTKNAPLYRTLFSVAFVEDPTE